MGEQFLLVSGGGSEWIFRVIGSSYKFFMGLWELVGMKEGIFWVGSGGWIFSMHEWWLVLVGRGRFWESRCEVVIFIGRCLEVCFSWFLWIIWAWWRYIMCDGRMGMSMPLKFFRFLEQFLLNGERWISLSIQSFCFV